jgi:glucoamylase
LWSTIKKAAEFMCDKMDLKTSLIKSVGLWEEKFGSHIYSNAAVYNALKTSSRIAEVLDENKLSEKWDVQADKIRSSLLELAWDSSENQFIKTVKPRDTTLDVSLIGLTFPFEVLPAQDDMMRKTVAAIENSFSYEVGGIGRYSGDVYYGGNPWILATLWLALYAEKLKDVKKMEELLKWTIKHATELDLLSEQVNKSEGSPISAVPLAWSHAFFILSALGIDELKAAKE